MSITPNRGLPLMESSQAQPEVVYNAAMEILDVAETLEVEQSGDSPGVLAVTKIKFVGATVSGSAGVATVTVDPTSGGGGSPLTVDALTNVTLITFTGPAVSVAAGATGEAVVSIDTVSGGSSGGGNLSADTHPIFGDALDDEFEGTSLDGKWTQGNWSSTSLAFADGAIKITPPNDGGLHAIYQNISGSTWKVRAKLHMFDGATGAGDNMGIFVRNSSSGANYTFGPFGPSGNLLLLSASSFTTLVASVQNSFPSFWTTSDLIDYRYYEIENNGTNLIWRTSKTGVNGSFVQFNSTSLATFITTADQVGLAIDTNHSGTGLICDWFRRMA